MVWRLCVSEWMCVRLGTSPSRERHFWLRYISKCYFYLMSNVNGSKLTHWRCLIGTFEAKSFFWVYILYWFPWLNNTNKYAISAARQYFHSSKPVCLCMCACLHACTCVCTWVCRMPQVPLSHDWQIISTILSPRILLLTFQMARVCPSSLRGAEWLWQLLAVSNLSFIVPCGAICIHLLFLWPLVSLISFSISVWILFSLSIVLISHTLPIQTFSVISLLSFVSTALSSFHNLSLYRWLFFSLPLSSPLPGLPVG